MACNAIIEQKLYQSDKVAMGGRTWNAKKEHNWACAQTAPFGKGSNGSMLRTGLFKSSSKKVECVFVKKVKTLHFSCLGQQSHQKERRNRKENKKGWRCHQTLLLA
eukprot:155510-Pelagomonas_calceolata.AAC.2